LAVALKSHKIGHQLESTDMALSVERIDHVVLNCRDVEATVAWYRRVLGMQREEFGDYRHVALKFGQQKFNVRPSGAKDWYSVANDAPGALDLCFITTQPPAAVVEHLKACEVEIVMGPTQKTGALGAMISVYCHDPDGNLIEIASYPDGR
jgi:catechol 2,3-dioxygenase-like lactoylglutathione lyase family enzyme